MSIAALNRCRTDSAVVVPGRWALGVVNVPLVAAGSLRPCHSAHYSPLSQPVRTDRTHASVSSSLRYCRGRSFASIPLPVRTACNCGGRYMYALSASVTIASRVSSPRRPFNLLPDFSWDTNVNHNALCGGITVLVLGCHCAPQRAAAPMCGPLVGRSDPWPEGVGSSGD